MRGSGFRGGTGGVNHLDSMGRSDVACVVVTHDRWSMLLSAVNSLASQTVRPGIVVLVDSASSQPEYGELETAVHGIVGSAGHTVVRVVRLRVNVGGSAGFAIGIEEACRLGAQWILVMDDDSCLEPSALESLLDVALRAENVGWVACRVKDERGRVLAYHNKRITGICMVEKPVDSDSTRLPVRADANAFLGLLISRRAVDAVGLPDRRYFVWSDDTEYTYRITRAGFVGLVVPGAVIVDRQGGVKEGNGRYAPGRMYYMMRNEIWFRRRYSLLSAGLHSLWLGARRLAWVMIRGDQRWLRLQSMCRGLVDGFRSGVEDGELRSVCARDEDGGPLG